MEGNEINVGNTIMLGYFEIKKQMMSGPLNNIKVDECSGIIDIYPSVLR